MNHADSLRRVSNARYSSFRWETFCRPGMYLSNLSHALDCDWQASGSHIHAHCVVDDFGTLVPVALVGMTTQGSFKVGAA